MHSDWYEIEIDKLDFLFNKERMEKIDRIKSNMFVRI